MSSNGINRSAFAMMLFSAIAMSDVAHASIEVASNLGSISVPGFAEVGIGKGNPYPSTINVGVSGNITDVNVSIFGLSHASVNDVGAMLVGPAGQKVVLFFSVGGDGGVSNLNWTIDDEASEGFSNSLSPLSGSYQPTEFGPVSFFTPIPIGPTTTSLSSFDGTNPLGVWSLYVQDLGVQSSGQIASGWSLTIDYEPLAEGTVPEPMSALVWSLLGAIALFCQRGKATA